MNRRVITFGTFDLFHLGHLNIVRRARQLGDFLVVGVSSDALNYSKKGIYPIYPLTHRLEIVRAIRYVNEVFVEESMELKREYILRYRAHILVMGDDWKGKFDEFGDICEVVYLSRTPVISSSEIRIVCQDPSPDRPVRWDVWQAPISTSASKGDGVVLHHSF